MGFRFRKSINAGPMRINFSKSGVGYSVGSKGFRYTRKANGGTRTTASVPGTGISYVTDSRKERPKSARNRDTSISPELPQSPIGSGDHREKEPIVTGIEVALAWLLGWTGAHKFYRKRFGMGFLYLLTCGLFFIGWFGDAIGLSVRYSDQRRGRSTPRSRKVGAYIVSFVCLLLLASCGGRSDTADLPAALTETTTTAVEEATAAPSMESTVPEVKEPETTIPEATVPETTAPETTIPETTVPETTEPETTEAAKTVPAATVEEKTPTYILNTGSMRFHKLRCPSVKDIAPHNYAEFFGSFSEAQDLGYKPCKRCLK